MNDDRSPGGFEDRLRAALVHRAGSVSAPLDEAGISAVASRARQRQTRRRWEAAALALVVVAGSGLGYAVSSGGGGRQGGQQVAGRSGSVGPHHLSQRDGVLVLPLSGTVTASQPGALDQHPGLGRGPASSFQGAPTAPAGATGIKSINGSASAGVPNAASTATTVASGPIDVAPSSSASLQRVYGHTSPDGVQVTAYDQPAGEPGSAPATAISGGPAQLVPAGSAPAQEGCLTTTQLTLEISDVAAVGTVTEPLFNGATGALVDVQIGEIGSAEGAPATWVMAQVGAGATSVEVQFADGTLDQAAVSPSGVVVLGHKGAPVTTLGNGSVATIDVLGPGGQVLAGYGLGTESAVPSSGTAPSALPAPGSVQPSDPSAATAAVTQAVTTALGCSASPLQRSAVVAQGDAIETLPSVGGSAMVNVDKVVFTSATAAVVQYHLNSTQLNQVGQGEQTGPLYAAATLTGGAGGAGGAGGTWQVSLSSVAPGIQVTPANQVGEVTVAPGGPLFVKSWSGGTAVAVYKALPGSQSQSGTGYGTGEAACTPAGGVVEEVTTPGAVDVLTAALFPTYATPLISAAVSTVGIAEGSPATVVAVEVGPQAASVSVTGSAGSAGSAGTVQESPVDGEAVIVLAGDAQSALGAAGSQLQVSDSSGTSLSTVSLQVDTSAPSGPSSLPSSLPTSGQAPADPQAATQAITQAFEAVFDCSTPPIQRVEQIQDGSLVAGALEQLDTGPYEALASSSYIDVTQIVFENPTLADVSYVIRFHSDTSLTFPMIGQAVIVSGNWRVSYATVCAAVSLGLGNCQT